ncbi:SDR family NAD(P)-dependent oxidoreductase [Glacieibacterium sp.]|uniref:SDR family NAD(P)-dependent oxidoreductase n=1 Tax=Glacieibacterium sp. TaxID=2860237 RepID=UPI003B0056B6
MEIVGRTIWVTGASSGIGEALARAYSERGANLILSGRRVEALQAVAATCIGNTLVLPFEATDYAALPVVVAQAQGWRGKVDMLVNNAGISQRSLGKDTEFAVYRQLMEVDFFAPLRLTQLLLSAMLEAGDGHFVAISSAAGKMGSPLRTGYCAAKHAMMGYFDALRAEVAHAGVRVTTVTPGFIRTGIAVSALTGDGAERGTSDADIEGGMAPDIAAAIIIDNMSNGVREIVVDNGPVAQLLALKRNDPDKLFDLMATKGARLAAAGLP